MNQILAQYTTLDFICEDEVICSLPTFLLEMLAKEKGESVDNECTLDNLHNHADQIANNEEHLPKSKDCIKYLQKVIPWESISLYIQLPSYILKTLEKLWTQNTNPDKSYTLELRNKKYPQTIYKYMHFNEERVRDLISNGKLYLSCPANFNDPFDCSLNELIRLTFIESAVGCFSAENNNTLMFSHYADYHRGICVGFKTMPLMQSLNDMNNSLRADLRPVWYLSSMPPFELGTQPALCATTKHETWRYEQEYRLFMVKEDKSLRGFGKFRYDKNSITEVICGCKASDETISSCKTFANQLDACIVKIAQRQDSQFGIDLLSVT